MSRSRLIRLFFFGRFVTHPEAHDNDFYVHQGLAAGIDNGQKDKMYFLIISNGWFSQAHHADPEQSNIPFLNQR
jgi:hypothetical protein